MSPNRAITDVRAVDRVLASSSSFSRGGDEDPARTVTELRLNPGERTIASQEVLDDMSVGSGPSDSDIQRAMRRPELAHVIGYFKEKAKSFLLSMEYRMLIAQAMRTAELSNVHQGVKSVADKLALAVAWPLAEEEAIRFLQTSPNEKLRITLVPEDVQKRVELLMIALRQGELGRILADVAAKSAEIEAQFREIAR